MANRRDPVVRISAAAHAALKELGELHGTSHPWRRRPSPFGMGDLVERLVWEQAQRDGVEIPHWHEPRALPRARKASKRRPRRTSRTC